MRSIFPGFYRRSDEELSQLWQEGIFVFDTNMLLNIYRYTQKTRNRYLEILGLLKRKNQLWIPYQAAYEYHDRRMAVIQGQLDAYTEVAAILQTTAQKLENSLGAYHHKHEFMHTEKFVEDINTVIKNAKKTVMESKSKDKREYEALKKQDIFLQKLEELFHSNVGNAYTGEVQREVYKQAQIRVELKIPPGWEDEDKKGYRKYGDIVLWFQLLDHARSQKKPIIFITDDGKKDWWVQGSQGKPIRPLPELVQEMFVEAGVLLHMYQGYSFIEAATQFLNLAEQPEVIEEAKEITEQNIAEFNQAKKQGVSLRALTGYYVAEELVLEWLRKIYGTSNTILVNTNFPDIIMIEPDGTRIGVEIKKRSTPYLTRDLASLVGLATIRPKGQSLHKFMIVIVCESIEYAHLLVERIKEKIEIPENTSFVIGYLGDETNFVVFSIVP